VLGTTRRSGGDLAGPWDIGLPTPVGA
jgi:hypothetical protein